MKVHEFTRETGEVVEFHRDAGSKYLARFIDGDRSSTKISCRAPLSDFAAWDEAAKRKALASEKDDRESYANLIRKNTELANDPWMKHPLAGMGNDSAEDRERSEA